MPLSIKDPEADRLARQVARLTGDTVTQTVVVALKEKLARETGEPLRFKGEDFTRTDFGAAAWG